MTLVISVFWLVNFQHNDFALANTRGEFIIYSSEQLKEKLKIKLFEEGKGINYALKLKNGNIACCGYEQIKFIHLDLYNQSFYVEKILEERNSNFISFIEFNNSCFIS